ncbi:hypothetical protein BC628DRAFT_199461 [Trametes gibbosa]|nr:hypothetical protein BC628DRAFT_199461 [Trametes gibbosa]
MTSRGPERPQLRIRAVRALLVTISVPFLPCCPSTHCQPVTNFTCNVNIHLVDKVQSLLQQRSDIRSVSRVGFLVVDLRSRVEREGRGTYSGNEEAPSQPIQMRFGREQPSGFPHVVARRGTSSHRWIRARLACKYGATFDLRSPAMRFTRDHVSVQNPRNTTLYVSGTRRVVD